MKKIFYFVFFAFLCTHGTKLFSISGKFFANMYVDNVIVGGGIGGLGPAYDLIKAGKDVVVFTTIVGGRALKDKSRPYALWYNLPLEWNLSRSHKVRAQELGCSSLESEKEGTRCLLDKLVKSIGAQRIREGYTLLEVKKSNDSNYPYALIFRNEKNKKIETVFVKKFDLMILPEQASKIKWKLN